MNEFAAENETLLTPSEVASLFRVDPKTVTRWAKAGKLSSVRTLGGHRRYVESEVRSLLESTTARTTLDAATPVPPPAIPENLPPVPPAPPGFEGGTGISTL